jgi:hypothetical protein
MRLDDKPKWIKSKAVNDVIDPKLQRALEALKLAYRKHRCDDESIGWNELGDKLCNALCEIMGDKEFVKWSESLE